MAPKGSAQPEEARADGFTQTPLHYDRWEGPSKPRRELMGNNDQGLFCMVECVCQFVEEKVWSSEAVRKQAGGKKQLGSRQSGLDPSS